jgi:hypothetical protein
MKRRIEDDSKQTVNYGTGSGTCEKCGEPIDKGIYFTLVTMLFINSLGALRIGKFKMNCVNGRYGEAGGHMKVWDLFDVHFILSLSDSIRTLSAFEPRRLNAKEERPSGCPPLRPVTKVSSQARHFLLFSLSGYDSLKPRDQQRILSLAQVRCLRLVYSLDLIR